MANAGFTIENENGREHDFAVDFSLNVENNSIGWYEYWGHMEYDHQPDYAVLDKIENVYLVRAGHVKTLEQIPKVKNIRVEEVRHDGKLWGYRWEHHRLLKNAEDIVEQHVIDYIEENQSEMFDELRPEPYYDDDDADRY